MPIFIVSKLDAPNDINNKTNKNRTIILINLLNYLFNFSKNFFAILKVGIVVEGTLIVSPVLGFLAVLANLIEGLKTPNPLNSALLPFVNAAVISLIIISSTLSASLTVILFISENLIIKSDFFKTTSYFFSSLFCLLFSFTIFFSFFISVVVFEDFASNAAPKISPKEAPESADT